MGDYSIVCTQSKVPKGLNSALNAIFIAFPGSVGKFFIMGNKKKDRCGSTCPLHVLSKRLTYQLNWWSL